MVACFFEDRLKAGLSKNQSPAFFMSSYFGALSQLKNSGETASYLLIFSY